MTSSLVSRSLKTPPPITNPASPKLVLRHLCWMLESGTALAAGVGENDRRLAPNVTYFTSVTRSVSEGNKGKRLMSSPSLTLRVGKVSAIGLAPCRSRDTIFNTNGGELQKQKTPHRSQPKLRPQSTRKRPILSAFALP